MLENVKGICYYYYYLAKLTDSENEVWSPRFNPDGSHLVYFEGKANGPHHTCAALKMVSHTVIFVLRV